MESIISSLSERQTEIMIGEIHELNSQIHQYLRITPQTFTLMLGIPTTATALAAVINFIDADSIHLYNNIIFLILPLILATLALYHLNVTTEVAALAEQRDRLCLEVNKKLKKDIFTSPYVSKYLRNSLGTISLFALGTLIIGVVTGIGIIITKHSSWFLPQIFSSLLTISSICVGAIQIITTRNQVKKELVKLDNKRKINNAT